MYHIGDSLPREISLFLLILFGYRVSLPQQVLMRDSFQINQLGGLAKITLLMVGFAILVQSIGFFAFLIRLASIYPFGEAIWQSLFHSISAFNNAGFTIFPNSESLSYFKNDYIILKFSDENSVRLRS